MHYELDCGGDKLCGKRHGHGSCPYDDEPNCAFYVPAEPEPKTEAGKGMSLDTVADLMQQVSRQYLAGEMDDQTFRAISGAIGFSALHISPKQAEMMINTAKMEVVTKQLSMMDDGAIIESLKKEKPDDHEHP